MSRVKVALAFVPRPVVALVPRSTRDVIRTRLLLAEKAYRRRLAEAKAPPAASRRTDRAPAVSEPAGATTRQERPSASSDDVRVADRSVREDVAALREDVERHFVQLERMVRDVNKRLDQLDSRVSVAASGDAPSVLDDLRDLVLPIEQLRRRLDELDGSSASLRDVSV